MGKRHLRGRRRDGRGLRPDAKLAISDLAEAAYARAPIPQLAPADFRVRGGSVYATDPGQDGKVWRPQAMWMPRLSAAYKLGEKTVLKAGYGIYYDTLNAADYTQNNPGFSATTTNTNSTNFGQTFLLGNPVRGRSWESPIRSRSAPTGPASTSRPDRRSASTRSPAPAYTIQNQNHEHARQQRWRFGVQRELARNLSVEVAYDGSYADRIEREHPGGLPAAAVLDSGQPERARCGDAGPAHRERDEPVHAGELRGAADDQPRAVSADVRQRLLHGGDGAAAIACCGRSRRSTT